MPNIALIQSPRHSASRHALDLTPTHVRQPRTKQTPNALSRVIRSVRAGVSARRGGANRLHASRQQGNRLGAGLGLSPFGFRAYTSNRNQRSIVKASYSKNSPTRSWAAHGEYLQREHAQEKGEKGWGFNSENDRADLKQTLREWQHANDEHVFRLIISPENGHRMDLKQHAKDLMKSLAADLKTPLEWVAIDHNNTDHAHLHIILRGRTNGIQHSKNKDQRHDTLLIDRDYLSQGIRYRSQELATQELGLRLDHEHVLAREKQIEREYVTDIDRSLRYRAINSVVSFERKLTSDTLIAREQRLVEVKRLRFLETIGLAEKVGGKSWKLNDNMEPTLHEMQLSNDIVKSRARHGIQTLTHELPAPTEITEQKPLTGLVIGMGLEDELRDRRYLLLEGTDGKVHYIRATDSITKARDTFQLANGKLITLEKERALTIQERLGYGYNRTRTETREMVLNNPHPVQKITIENHTNLNALTKVSYSKLDRDVMAFVTDHAREPQAEVFPAQCFAHEYAKAMQKRFIELLKDNVFIEISTPKHDQDISKHKHTPTHHRQFQLSDNYKRALTKRKYRIEKTLERENQHQHEHQRKHKLDHELKRTLETHLGRTHCLALTR